jgi:hypothetical protein
MIKVTIDIDIQKEFEKEYQRQRKEKMKDLMASLVEATPIDTGEARKGWYLTDDSINNDVEYVKDLNQGTSRQAPARFIEKTLLSQSGVKPRGTIVRST